MNDGPNRILQEHMNNLDVLRRWEVFGQGAAKFLNGLADLGTNLIVRHVGLLFPLDVLPLQLFFCLRGTEEIGGQSSPDNQGTRWNHARKLTNRRKHKSCREEKAKGIGFKNRKN